MSKSVFIKNGSEFRVSDDESVIVYDDLPVATYAVHFNKDYGFFYLTQIDDFTLPEKIYGDQTSNAERILNTFSTRSNSTGVLLSGIKGAGKTLLSKQISLDGAKKGYPTIVVNQPHSGDDFNKFMQSISTPSIIIFDEFEKVYDYQNQGKLLTLLDGVYPARKLFVLTANSDRRISEFLRNRPGRIYYSLEFDTLGQDFIEEFLDDRLKDSSKKDGILKYTRVFSFFNFDMLAALVEEINRYHCSISEALSWLNIVPENNASDTFTIELSMDSSVVVMDREYRDFQPGTFNYIIYTNEDELPKPIRDCEAIHNQIDNMANSDQYGQSVIKFTPDHIDGFDPNTEKFTYCVKNGTKNLELCVTRNTKPYKWNYHPDAY